MLQEVNIYGEMAYDEGFELREVALLDILQSKKPDNDLVHPYEIAILEQSNRHITEETCFAVYDWVRAITDAVDVLTANRDKDDDFANRDSEGYRYYKDRTTRIKCLYKRVIKNCQDFWAALNGEGQYKLIPENIKAEIFESLVRIQYWALQEAVVQRHLCYAVPLVSQKRPVGCRFYSTWRSCPADDDFWILDDFTLVAKKPEKVMPRLGAYFAERMDKIDCDPKTFGTFRR